MKVLITAILFLSLSFGLSAAGLDFTEDKNIAIGQALRSAAENGDAEAMMRLALHLNRHAPNESKMVDLCDGIMVTPAARGEFEAQGHQCETGESPEHNARIEKWRLVGFKSDSDHWFRRAAESGNEDALAFQCLAENNPSPEQQAFCAQIGGRLDELKATAFTGCALVTETVAKILTKEKKTRDAIDYYRRASDDYLAGASSLVDREVFEAILDQEIGKLRDLMDDNENSLDHILQKARQCAQALENLS